MRALLVIVVIALVLVFVGWLKFSSPDGNPTLQVDTDKVKHDTQHIVEGTKDVVHEATEDVDHAIEHEPDGL